MDDMTLDRQDYVELISLVQQAWGAEFGMSLFEPDTRPTTRMLALRSLEYKLIVLKGEADE